MDSCQGGDKLQAFSIDNTFEKLYFKGKEGDEEVSSKDFKICFY